MPIRKAAGLTLIAALGALAGLAPGAIAYLLTHGLQPSDYAIISRQIGFDFTLLPFQWVTIMLSPGPMLAATPAIIPLYPWFAFGMAGVFCGVVNARNWPLRRAHILVGAAAFANLIAFLCYRDLHSVGLFRYGNQHYFKGVSAIFVVFTIVLAEGIIRAPRTRIVAGLALLFVLSALPWRVHLAYDPQNSPTNIGAVIMLPGGFKGIGYTLAVETKNHAVDYGHTGAVLKIANNIIPSITAYRLVPTPSGFIVQAVRKLPMGPAELDLPSGVTIDSGQADAIEAGWFTYCPSWQCKPPRG